MRLLIGVTLYLVTAFILWLIGIQVDRWLRTDNWLAYGLFFVVIAWLAWRWDTDENKDALRRGVTIERQRWAAWWGRWFR